MSARYGDPLAGMRPEQRRIYERWTSAMQRAYAQFRKERFEHRAAHRDSMEAFRAGWDAHAVLVFSVRKGAENA